MCRRFHAVVAAAQIGAVEIELQDFLLGNARLDPQRKESLVDFALDRAFRAEEKVLGNLLGQGRAALTTEFARALCNDRPQRADDVHPEMVKEAGVFRGKHRLDQGRRNFFKRNGVVLPDAALADDFAIGIGKGDGKFAALVPDIPDARERRQGKGQKAEGKHHPEGGKIINDVDQEAARAGDLEAVNKRGIGRTPALEGVPGFKNARTHKRVKSPENTGKWGCDWVVLPRF